MAFQRSVVARLLSLGAAGLAAASSQGQISYTFTKVADSAIDQFDPMSVTAPSISDQGHVAFSAQSADRSVSKVVRSGAGGIRPLATIADSNVPGVWPYLSTVSVNAAGQVVFWASNASPGAQQAIHRGSGGALQLIADTGPLFNSLAIIPSINDAGVVAFQAELDGPALPEGLFLGQSSVTTVFRTDSGPFSDSFAGPCINNLGQVAFRGILDTGEGGVFRYDGGTTYTKIVDDTGSYNTHFDDEPSLNAAGTVAVIGWTDDYSVRFLLVGNGVGAAQEVADTRGWFSDFFAVSLNDSGKLAVWGSLDDLTTAIFVGPNPVTDRLIGAGDALDGSVVSSVVLCREGLSNDGTVAFTAYLTDGRSVVMTARGGACLANCDNSAGVPVLTANDFQCFLTRYAAGEPAANCDGSTGTPALTANDLQCFLNAYLVGCN
jgi:hypothetical protein